MSLNMRKCNNVRAFGGIREDYEPKIMIPCQTNHIENRLTKYTWLQKTNHRLSDFICIYI
jgi:hypothetical protein